MIGVVILSGGEGKRMGGVDKGLCKHNGKTFFEIVLEQLMPQATKLQNQTKTHVKFFVSANRNLHVYQAKLKERNIKGEVVTDIYPEPLGPMAGMVSVMKSDTEIKRWVFCSVDCLALPEDYLLQLYSDDARRIVCLKYNHQIYPTHVSLPAEGVNELEVAVEHHRLSIKRWLEEVEYDCVFSTIHQPLKHLNH